MKKNIRTLCFLFLLASTVIIHAGTLEETFLHANAIYQEGDFASALQLYESINPKGPAVLANMGNCYYHIGQLGNAVLYWYRAQKQSDFNNFSSLQATIEKAYHEHGIALYPTMISRISYQLTKVSKLCSLLTWQLLLLAVWLMLSLVAQGLYSRRRYFLIFLLSLLVIITGTMCIVAYTYQNRKVGMVVKQSIPVYAGPGTDFVKVDKVSEFQLLRIYQQRDHWFKVAIKNKGYGWIAVADIAML